MPMVKVIGKFGSAVKQAWKVPFHRE